MISLAEHKGMGKREIIEALNQAARSGRSILGAFEYLDNSDPKSADYYGAVERAYGIKPALFSTYYPFDGTKKRFLCEEADKRLIKHYNEGALCLVHSQNNRWAEDLVTEEDKTDFICNLDETNEKRNMIYYNRYLEVREQWAEALLALKNAGVTVIYRPFVEMTNIFHWDGNTKSEKGFDAFKRVWKQLYNYMTKDCGLDNLLWCFAPQAGGGAQKGLKFWPGDEYVDIIGITLYSRGNKDGPMSISRELELWDYSGYFSLGKPVGFSELGVKPQTDADTGEITEPGDFSNLLKHIKSNLKGKISFCCMWCVELGLLHENHLFAKEFVNDKFFINLPELIRSADTEE